MSWPIALYVEENGRCPIEEFLESIPLTHQAKINQRVKMLAELGPNLPFPYSSQVTGKLRELRAKYGNAQYRLLYYGDRNRAFILLHAFLKKTEEIPEQEKELALKRMKRDEQNKSS